MSGATYGAGIPATERRGVPWRRGARVGLLASAANAAIYGVAVIAGVFPYFLKVDPTQPGLTVLAVVLVTMVASVAGVALQDFMERRFAAGTRIFLWVASVVLLLSFAAPYAVPGTTASQAWIQNLMHVVVAAAVVLGVGKRSRPG